MITRLTALTVLTVCALPTVGLTISKSIGESDVTRDVEYFADRNGGPTTYIEDVTYEQQVVLSPGEKIDVKLVFPDPLNLYTYYPDKPFSITLMVTNGGAQSSLASFEGGIALIDTTNASVLQTTSQIITDQDTIDISSTAMVVQTAPGDMQFGRIIWEETSLNNFANNSAATFKMVIHFQTRGPGLVKADQNLITFVPEPTSAALVVLPSMMLLRRRR